MFFSLLIVTFTLSVLVAVVVAKTFEKSIALIFERIIQDQISIVWQKYIKFITYVVGISGGVRIYQLERYISAEQNNDNTLVLNIERWTLEVYRTIIETLQSLAWMYLMVFIFTLIAYVIVRGLELRKKKK